MRVGLSAAFCLCGLAGLALATLLAAPAPSSPPSLVVVVVIDQFRYDYLTRFDALYERGFRTLLDDGALFTNARFRHATMVTSTGHSVISTGHHPSHTGITANNWYDPIRKRRVGAVWDSSAKAVGGSAEPASPRTLLADTLGDHLKRKHSGSRVVSVAWKNRSALLLAGREADAGYWFSPDCGCFVTSDHYMDIPPKWLTQFNRRRSADQFYGEAWERILEDISIYEQYSRRDDFEAENGGEHTTFPHPLKGEPPDVDFYLSVGDSAFNDEVVLRAALAALEGHDLGLDNEPDLLNISLAGTDRVGHAFGPFSQEAMDQVLRLDYLLDWLLRELDDRVGLDNTLIALTADHGALPLVEHLQAQGIAAKRIPRNALTAAVNQAIADRYPGVKEAVAYFDPPHVFFDLARLERHGVLRTEAEQLGRQALLATGFVEKVYTHSDMLGEPPANDRYWRLYRNSFYEPRSQHLIVLLKKHHYVDGSQGSTGHTSPYDYDRHVPILVFGQGIRAGRYERDCGPEDLAPTLGKWLGLSLPREPDSKLLHEAVP